MNRHDGRPLTGWPHVLQSLRDIWTTPKGTRVMRRTYGSSLMDLMDKPGTLSVVLEAVMSAAEAETWEPRFRVREVAIASAGADGVFELEVSGVYFPNGHKGDFSVYEAFEGERVRI